MLEINHINVFYGDTQVIKDVSFNVREGEIVAIIGSNGAGKSTILKTIVGLLHPQNGHVKFLNHDISTHPAYQNSAAGLALVPEGRHVFGGLSVEDNLDLGAYHQKDKARVKESFEKVYDIFPFLHERRHEKASSFSGGQQQMLVIARGLMSEPKLLMLDEPSLGLAPIIVTNIFDVVKKINTQGVTILLVEQQTKHALELADRAYVLETGKITLEGKSEEVLNSPLVKKAYLGM